MKRTTFLITLIMAVAMLGVLGAVLPASAEPPHTPITLPAWPPLNLPQPIGAACSPEAPVAIEANNLQITFQAQQDSYVRQTAPDTNNGTATYLRVGRILMPADAYQTLIQFDISSLPANAVIVTATLEMYTPISSTPGLRAYAALGSWAENTVTWNTKPTYSTDYGSQTVNGLGYHAWNVTALAQQWQAGTRTNNGFLLAQAGTIFGTLDYNSRTNASSRPRLTVIYATQGSPAILPVQADTWINQALPSNNYGNDSGLYVGRVTGNARNTLLKFDTSSLPSSVVVISAALELYSEINLLNAPEAATDIWADAIISTWDEGTVNWNSKPVTQTMGDLPKAYATGWLRWDVTNLVRGWYSGTIPNHGIQLRLDPTGAGGYYFFALPSNSAARLVIAYHTCTAPLTGVSINGATSGVTGTQYTFTPVPVPANPTAPITYTWRVSDLVCGGSHQPLCPTGATLPYTFTTTGTKTITVTAQNCGGATYVDTHQIVISTPPPTCPNPISDVSVIGVSGGLTGTNYTFTATASPINPTTPITFTWQATDQLQQVTSGVLTQTSKTINWSGAGAKTITVTAQNCGGAAQATKAVNIVPAASLPD